MRREATRIAPSDVMFIHAHIGGDEERKEDEDRMGGKQPEKKGK